MNNREAFEAWAISIGMTQLKRDRHDRYTNDVVYGAWEGYQAALASQAQQTELFAWGYAWQCKSVGDWRIEKLGEGCIPPKDTLALYTVQQAQQEPVSQWISVEERLPEVKNEDYEFVLVAVDSAHTGKTHVFEAAYLNQVEVMTEDGNYISFTGWHTRSEHPDYDGWYEPIGGNGDDRVVTHWMPLPLPPAR
jgi:hypothetical protein